MPTVRIATEADLRRAVPLDRAAVACVESAFRALASGAVVMPPILRMDLTAMNGEVDVKTAWIPGLDRFAIKISPGFFDNPALGLPSLNGLMTVFSARTGLLEAVLLDNGYLTDVRTAAAGAVAAMHLAREDAECAVILGAGAQARLQLQALTLVRPIRRAAIWARDADKAEAAAREMSATLGIEVTAAADARAAVAVADVIVTTTPATTPILMDGWLRPGQHVTAMGSDGEHKNEVDPGLFRHVVYVADSVAQTARHGELRAALAAGTADRDARFAELGAVAAGAVQGRPYADAITLCDLTGTGAQDTAIADLALTRLQAAGAGMTVDA